MTNRDGPSLAYHQGTDSFNLQGPHGEGLMTLSAEGLKALIQEGNRLLLDRSQRRREWEKKLPLNDSAEVSEQNQPHQEA